MPVWPVPRFTDGRAPVISDGFGPRSTSFHRGADIMYRRIPTDCGPGTNLVLPSCARRFFLPLGVPAVSFDAGRVVISDDKGRPGRIRVDHGGGIQTEYRHLFSRNAQVGDLVRAGQALGNMGHNREGFELNHLHFVLIKNGTMVDPAPFLARAAVAPMPFRFGKALVAAGLGVGAYYLYTEYLS